MTNEETNDTLAPYAPPMPQPAAPVYQPQTIVQYAVHPQGVAGIAGQMVAAGLSVLEAQQLIAHVQETAQQAATAAMPKLLDAVRKVQAERIADLRREVAAIPHRFGLVSRDRILQLIDMLHHTPPRTSRG